MQKNIIYSIIPLFLNILAHANYSLPALAIEPLQELRAADKTQWTITIAPKAENQADMDAKSNANKTINPSIPSKHAMLQSIGAKDSGVYRIENRYNNQKQEEYWILGKYQFLKSSDQEKITRLSSSRDEAWNIEESDFPELYWATGQLPELQKINGKKLLVIKMDASQKPLSRSEQRDLEIMKNIIGPSEYDSSTQKNSSFVNLLLYLDPETRMPVRFEDIDRIYYYSFAPSPNLMSVIPEDFKKDIADFEKNLAELTRPPSTPKVRNRKKQTP
jgi:hypothetical protein